jgi:predicted peptidase
MPQQEMPVQQAAYVALSSLSLKSTATPFYVFVSSYDKAWPVGFAHIYVARLNMDTDTNIA